MEKSAANQDFHHKNQSLEAQRVLNVMVFVNGCMTWNFCLCAKPDPRQDAIKEMMLNIQQGTVKLRKTKPEPAPVKSDAMQQIAEMIKRGPTLKKSKKETKQEKPAAPSISSELQKKLDRRARKISGVSTTDGGETTDSSEARPETGGKSSSPPPVVCVTPNDEPPVVCVTSSDEPTEEPRSADQPADSESSKDNSDETKQDEGSEQKGAKDSAV